jgi:heat shock protein HtpX
MRRKPLGRDRALSTRLLGTVAGLCVLYAIAFALLVMFVAAWALVGVPLIAALGLLAASVVMIAFVVQASPRSALGARELGPADAPSLRALVERLCALADLPVPRIAFSESDLPAAFVTGLTPARTTLTVTRGLLARLDERELGAVVAHELAHVANRDGAVMTVSVFPSWAGRWVAVRLAGRWPWLILVPFVWGYLLIGWLIYLFSNELMLALSRLRELSADRGAAILTGDPAGLMSALTKLSGAIAQIPECDLRVAAGASALLIVPTEPKDTSHPPLEERLAQLGEIARELGNPVAPSGMAAVHVACDAGRESSRLGPAITAFFVTFVVVLAVLLAAQVLAD